MVDGGFSLVLLGHDASFDEIDGGSFAARLSMALNIDAATANRLADSVPVALETDAPFGQAVALEALLKAIGGHCLVARNRALPSPDLETVPAEPKGHDTYGSEAATEFEMKARTAQEIAEAAATADEISTADVPQVSQFNTGALETEPEVGFDAPAAPDEEDEPPTAQIAALAAFPDIGPPEESDVIELEDVASTHEAMRVMTRAESIELDEADLPGDTRALPDFPPPPGVTEGLPEFSPADLPGKSRALPEFDGSDLPGSTRALPNIDAPLGATTPGLPNLDAPELAGPPAIPDFGPFGGPPQSLPEFEGADLPGITRATPDLAPTDPPAGPSALPPVSFGGLPQAPPAPALPELTTPADGDSMDLPELADDPVAPPSIPIVVGAALTGERPAGFEQPRMDAMPSMDEFEDLSLPGDTNWAMPAIGGAGPALGTADLPGHGGPAMPPGSKIRPPSAFPAGPSSEGREWNVRRTATSMRAMSIVDLPGLSAEHLKSVTSAAMPVLTASALEVMKQTDMPVLEQGDDDELVLCWADDVDFLPGGGSQPAAAAPPPPSPFTPPQQPAHQHAPVEQAAPMHEAGDLEAPLELDTSPKETACPKCGFKQSGTEMCQLCGVIFAKARRRPQQVAREPEARQVSAIDGAIGAFRKLFSS